MSDKQESSGVGEMQAKIKELYGELSIKDVSTRARLQEVITGKKELSLMKDAELKLLMTLLADLALKGEEERRLTLQNLLSI